MDIEEVVGSIWLHQEVPASGGGFPSSKFVQFHKASSFPSSFSCTLCSESTSR
jgi:hypothetical protein